MITLLSFVCISLLFIVFVLAFNKIGSSNSKTFANSNNHVTTDSEILRAMKADDALFSAVVDGLEQEAESQKTFNAWLANVDLENKIRVVEKRKKLNERMVALSSENPTTTIKTISL